MNPDLMIGAIYQGKYRVHSQLGVGETSRVFLLDDLHLPGRRVVLKYGVASQQLPQVRLRTIFEHERDVLLALPRDVRPDFFDSRLEIPELSLEYVTGASLATYFEDWISPSPRSFPQEAQLLEVANSLVRRVATCHAHQVIVADLKPEHILVTPCSPLQVTLIDFGRSVLASRTVPGQSYSPIYAAPEVRTGESATPACDVYSLGILLQAMWQILSLRNWPARRHPPGDFGVKSREVHPQVRILIRSMTQSDRTRRPSLNDVQAVLDNLCLESSESPIERLQVAAERQARSEVLYWAFQVDRRGLWATAPGLRVLAAEAAMADGDDELARRLIDDGLSQGRLTDDQTRRLLLVLFKYLEKVRTPPEAWRPHAERFRSAADHWPNVEEFWLGRVRASLANEQEKLIGQALNLHPRSGALHFCLTEVHTRRGNLQQVLVSGTEALRLGYHSAKIARGLLQLAAALKDAERQEWLRGHLREFSPKSAEDCWELSQIAREGKNVEDELKLLELGLTLAPDDGPLRERFAEVIFHQRKYETVCDRFRSSATTPLLKQWLSFSLVEFCKLSRSDSSSEEKKWEIERKRLLEEALPLLDELSRGTAQNSRPPIPLVFRYLVTCLKLLNRHKEALKAVARGIEQHPQNANLRELFDRFSQPPGRSKH